MRTASVSFPAALFSLLLLAGTASADYTPTAEQRTACMGDALKLCASDIPNTSRIITCLARQKARVSPRCRVFFDRAGLQDTKVGQSPKDNPADVAEAGFKAMMDGEADVVTGLMNKLETTIANVTPNEMLAERTRKQYEPGSGKSVNK